MVLVWFLYWFGNETSHIRVDTTQYKCLSTYICAHAACTHARTHTHTHTHTHTPAALQKVEQPEAPPFFPVHAVRQAEPF